MGSGSRSSRGKNFTTREKCKLMELIQKYRHIIIDDKCTKARTLAKKSKTWETIAAKFNYFADEQRSVKQLQIAYTNLKMKSKLQRSIADANVHDYLEQKKIKMEVILEPGTPPEIQMVRQIEEPPNKSEPTDTSYGQFRQETYYDESTTKSEPKDTSSLYGQTYDEEDHMAADGGGYNVPVVSLGAQTDAVMGDQMKPLANNYDSASSYFNNVSDDDDDDNIPVIQTLNELDVPVNEPRDDLKTRRKTQQNKKKPSSNEQFRKQYFLHKLQCVIIEKKTKLLEHRMLTKKNKLLDLELKIKQKEYDNLIGE